MEKKSNNYLKTLSVFMLTGLLFACATMTEQKVESTQKLLTQAGFKMKLADTPEKIAHLKGLQQHKIFVHQKEGKSIFTYADAEFCKCLYVGGQQSYSNFLTLQASNKLMEQEQELAASNEGTAMNWEMWNIGGTEAYYQ